MAENPKEREERMDPDRLRALRRKVATGFYDRPDVLLEVARRILASGDA